MNLTGVIFCCLLLAGISRTMWNPNPGPYNPLLNPNPDPFDLDPGDHLTGLLRRDAKSGMSHASSSSSFSRCCCCYDYYQYHKALLLAYCSFSLCHENTLHSAKDSAIKQIIYYYSCCCYYNYYYYYH